jgi:hypothetical protein
MIPSKRQQKFVNKIIDFKIIDFFKKKNNVFFIFPNYYRKNIMFSHILKYILEKK